MISETEIIDIKKSIRSSLVPFRESIAFARAIEKILVERITNHCVDALSSLDNGSDAIMVLMTSGIAQYEQQSNNYVHDDCVEEQAMTVIEECEEILAKKEK